MSLLSVFQIKLKGYVFFNWSYYLNITSNVWVQILICQALPAYVVIVLQSFPCWLLPSTAKAIIYVALILNWNKIHLLKSQVCAWISVWDNLVFGTLGPWIFWSWNPCTSRLLDLFSPTIPPHTSTLILLPPPNSSSYSPSLV